MELLKSEIVAQVALQENLYRDVNDAVQKVFTVLRSNIWRKTEYSINTEMTITELVPPKKTKSATNDMHSKRNDFISSKTVFARPFIAQTTFKKSITIYLE